MVSNWSLSDSKSQASRTLLSILANLNNAVVWMVSTCPLISKSSSPFTNPLGIGPSASITIDITVTFVFHSFFLVLKQSLDIYLSFCFLLIYYHHCRNFLRRIFWTSTNNYTILLTDEFKSKKKNYQYNFTITKFSFKEK